MEGDHSLARQRAALQKTTIDQVALNTAKAYKNYFQGYMEHLPADTTRVYRYEDIIFKKKSGLKLERRKLKLLPTNMMLCLTLKTQKNIYGR